MVKNLSGSSFYRVNDSVMFEDDWFDYIVSSPLPPYFRIIPIVFDSHFNVSFDYLLDYLSKNFSFCVIDKYLPKQRISVRVVTSKSLEDLIKLLSDFNYYFGKCLTY